MKKAKFCSFWALKKRDPRGPLVSAHNKQLFYNITLLQRCRKTNFSPFCSTIPEKIEVKAWDRQTYRQSDKILTPYTASWVPEPTPECRLLFFTLAPTFEEWERQLYYLPNIMNFFLLLIIYDYLPNVIYHILFV